MPNTPRAGRNAQIMVDTSSGGTGSAVTITGKNKWVIDQSVDTYEVTSFGDSNKTYVVGLPNASGEFSGFWDSADNLIYNLIGSSVARKMYLYPDVTNNATSYFFTTAYISVKHEGGTAEAVSFSGTWNAATVASWVHP